MSTNSRILSVGAIRKVDARAIGEVGIAGCLLMERAGTAVASVCMGIMGDDGQEVTRALVLCGKGNNGGDGFVVARLLHAAGLEVKAVFFGQVDAVDPLSDAGHHLELAKGVGVEVEEVTDEARWLDGREALSKRVLVVDALLGTGLRGDVREGLAKVVEWINAGDGTVVAVDVPSGLDADQGVVQGVAVRADQTVTFGAAKPGFYLGAGPGHVGELRVDSIGLPEWLLDEEA